MMQTIVVLYCNIFIFFFQSIITFNDTKQFNDTIMTILMEKKLAVCVKTCEEKLLYHRFFDTPYLDLLFVASKGDC